MTHATSPTLDRVLAGQLCSGCGLCASLGGEAVAFGATPPGLLRPRQTAPVDDATESVIAAACPGSRVAPWPEEDGVDPSWGPIRELHTGHAADGDLRYAASSGGVLSALLIHALETGAVDAIIHTAADPADPIGTVTVRSTDAASIIAASGSRYSPSSPLLGVAALLAEEGRRFAIVGKPCDISALRQLATKDARVDQRFPLMLSFFCGGIPSYAGTQQILSDLDVRADDVAAFSYRGEGWPGYAVATRHDGSTERMTYAQSWGGRLSKHVQFRCKICPDAIGGVADIACADAWYGDSSGYPAFEEAEGRSLIVARSAAGAALLHTAVAAGVLETQPLAVTEIDAMQPSQARRKRLLISRYAALKLTGQPVPDVRGLRLWQAARHSPVGDAARNFLGMIRRVAKGRK